MTTPLSEAVVPPTSNPTESQYECVEPDISHLVTEDDTPVDNLISEKQQRFLTTCLYSSLSRDVSFLATANVGLFYGLYEPPLVPDVLVSFGVSVPEDWSQKKHRSYFVWEFGKPPEVAIEIVSNREGNELGRKLIKYANARVAYYIVFDPLHQYGEQMLRVYQLIGNGYQQLETDWMEQIELGLTLWQGRFEGKESTWLRWCDRNGNLLLTGDEIAENERQRAENERQRADRLAEFLRSQGFNPDEI